MCTQLMLLLDKCATGHRVSIACRSAFDLLALASTSFGAHKHACAPCALLRVQEAAGGHGGG